MTEEADEAVESAKSEVNSHPLNMEIEIEEEIKEDRELVTFHKSYIQCVGIWKATETLASTELKLASRTSRNT